jgi:hypothetical protein
MDSWSEARRIWRRKTFCEESKRGSNNVDQIEKPKQRNSEGNSSITVGTGNEETAEG